MEAVAGATEDGADERTADRPVRVARMERAHSWRSWSMSPLSGTSAWAAAKLILDLTTARAADRVRTAAPRRLVGATKIASLSAQEPVNITGVRVTASRTGAPLPT